MKYTLNLPYYRFYLQYQDIFKGHFDISHQVQLPFPLQLTTQSQRTCTVKTQKKLEKEVLDSCVCDFIWHHQLSMNHGIEGHNHHYIFEGEGHEPRGIHDLLTETLNQKNIGIKVQFLKNTTHMTSKNSTTWELKTSFKVIIHDHNLAKKYTFKGQEIILYDTRYHDDQAFKGYVVVTVTNHDSSTINYLKKHGLLEHDLHAFDLSEQDVHVSKVHYLLLYTSYTLFIGACLMLSSILHSHGKLLLELSTSALLYSIFFIFLLYKLKKQKEFITVLAIQSNPEPAEIFQKRSAKAAYGYAQRYEEGLVLPPTQLYF